MNIRRTLIVACALLCGAVTGQATTSDPEAACARVESRIAGLRLKLRLGYTAREGRVLQQKLVALEAERRRVCRR